MGETLTGQTPKDSYEQLAHWGDPGAFPADGATPLKLLKGDGTESCISVTATKVFINGIEVKADFHKYDGTVAPTVDNDETEGFSIGSLWIDTVAKEAYRCTDATDGAAVWIESTLDPSEVAALLADYATEADRIAGDAASVATAAADATAKVDALKNNIRTSPALFYTNNGGVPYFAAAADFDSDALSYINLVGRTGTNAFVIDDIVKMLKGSASSTSRRGSTWTTLAANRWTNVKGIYLLQSGYNYGSGTVVADLKRTLDLTIAGGMAWNSAGFTFDGVDDQLNGAAPLITSGQWSLMAVGKMTGTSNGAIASQNNAANFRVSFLVATPTVAANFKRVEPTSYGIYTTTPLITKNSFLSVQNATDLKIYASGSETAEATTALAATTIENSNFIIGSVTGGGSVFKGDLQLVILWGEDISTDYSEIHANLNSLLGLGI